VTQEPAQAHRHEVPRIASQVAAKLSGRLSPEGTRRATLFERLTVRRLPWHVIVRLNTWLSATGKVATAIWCSFIASIVIGFDWRDVVQNAFNSGKSFQHVALLMVLVPTIIFLLCRSGIGWARWRLQRELWRRDVERLSR
jgi:hypothetical protein